MEIPSITNLATTTALNAKINEVKTKISNITNVATTAALTAKNNTKNNETENKLLLIMIMINILLLKNLISQHQIILLQD